MEGKDAEKMDSESPFRLSSGCLFVYVGGLSDDGMLCFRPGIEHAPGGVLPPYEKDAGNCHNSGCGVPLQQCRPPPPERWFRRHRQGLPLYEMLLFR